MSKTYFVKCNQCDCDINVFDSIILDGHHLWLYGLVCEYCISEDSTRPSKTWVDGLDGEWLGLGLSSIGPYYT